jgi:two-component system response regulator WspF
MRIAVVNDLRIALFALTRIVERMPDATLAWTAVDGAEAVAKCAADRPDLILMDLIMPVLDGVEATRRIMRDSPCPILVVTATIEGNAGHVFEALGAGALDAVETPAFDAAAEGSGAARLRAKIEQIARTQRIEARPPAPSPPTARSTHASSEGAPLVLLGASTGGPQALATVLRGLPAPPPFAVVIVQHLDAAFVPGFRQWLAAETSLRVEAATPGRVAEPGVVAVASGTRHLQIGPGGAFMESDDPADALHKPSVDSLMLSAAASRRRGAAALLTGMGRDGAAGLLALRQAGWTTFAQDAGTSVVWGMPGAAAQLKAAAHVLPVDQIGPAIQAALAGKFTRDA